MNCSDASMHCYNQLNTICQVIEHKQEAEKRYIEAQPIMEQVRQQLIVTLSQLINENEIKIKGFVQKEITEWQEDTKQHIHNIGVAGTVTGQSDKPLREILNNYNRSIEEKIKTGKVKMEGKLRCAILQLQIIISDEIRGKLQEVYQHLHQNIDDILKTKLLPVLQYLHVSLPELDEIDMRPDLYLETRVHEVIILFVILLLNIILY